MSAKSKRNELELVLNSLHSSISSFDSKAMSLLTATGIIFAFSATSFEFLFIKSTILVFNILSYIFGCLYLVFSVLSIACCVITILPRCRNKKEKNNNQIYNKYYEDVFYNKENEKLISSEPSTETLFDQVSINSRIAHQKSKLSRISVILIIIMAILLFFTALFIGLGVAFPANVNN